MNKKALFFGIGSLSLLIIGLSAFIKKSPSVLREKRALRMEKRDPGDGRELFKLYCGSCHTPPDPADLTKEIWLYNILPPMGSRLGIIDPNYDPYKGLSAEEVALVKKNNIFPYARMLSDDDWEKLKSYILKNAPDTMAYDRSRLTRDLPLMQFVRKDIQLDDRPPSLITGLEYDEHMKTLWIGDNYNQVYSWKWNVGVTRVISVASPVVDFNFFEGGTYFTEIGKLYPSELSTGSYARVNDSTGAETSLLSSLHRPVDTEIEDLNNDGVPEIVVCNFGNRMGSLSLFKKDKKTQQYTGQVLLNIPGATKCYLKDMDGDGKKDIVVLFAQGDEGVYILYQKDNLKFKAKRVLRFPPDYGTTDMVLVDYNHDGLMDIVTVHGDNADYSPVLKSFHGIRLHINQGNDNFQEKFFFPLYGVTKVLADDFDQDGDIDFAASCFFPDYGALVDESFTYLENVDSAHFKFKSYTQKSELPVKSLTIEKADIDGDGDMDIILGNFARSPGHDVPSDLNNRWNAAKYGLIIFENQLRQPARK